VLCVIKLRQFRRGSHWRLTTGLFSKSFARPGTASNAGWLSGFQRGQFDRAPGMDFRPASVEGHALNVVTTHPFVARCRLCLREQCQRHECRVCGNRPRESPTFRPARAANPHCPRDRTAIVSRRRHKVAGPRFLCNALIVLVPSGPSQAMGLCTTDW